MSGNINFDFSSHFHPFIALCIWETPKQVLLQTVKTKMKCIIMMHFIRVHTVCKGRKDLQTKEYNIFLKL